MTRKIKCKWCLALDDAGKLTKVKLGYVHSDECYDNYMKELKLKNEQNNFFGNLVAKIVEIHNLGKITFVPPRFIVYLKELKKQSNDDLLYKYLEQSYEFCKDKIHMAKYNKEFNSTFDELIYALTIVRNNLGDSKRDKKYIYKRVLTEDQVEILNKYKFESEIEKIMISEILFSQHSKNYKIDIITQKKFLINGRKYRTDILLNVSLGNKIVQFLIECDGHDSHEKTKEQAMRDKQRDRDFISAGIPTLRFSGSEIYNSVNECVKEVYGILDNEVNNFVVQSI